MKQHSILRWAVIIIFWHSSGQINITDFFLRTCTDNITNKLAMMEYIPKSKDIFFLAKDGLEACQLD